METRELIKKAKEKGITIKTIANITNIAESTIYHFNCGCRNLSKEKEEKIYNALIFLLDL